MQLDDILKLSRCPHCSIDQPNLQKITNDITTTTDNGSIPRIWRFYSCNRCGGVVTASAHPNTRNVYEIFPDVIIVDEVLPHKVKTYLQQAIDSTFAPSGAVMLCASSVDAMLKEFGYKEGSLYKRIDKAEEDRIITKDMAKWAHQVRLDANDERHADEYATLPTVEDAKQSIEFTKTLAELLFVLPLKVNRGLEATKVPS